MADIHTDKIIILDFGSQYTQLIARRIRELGVYCEIHPATCETKLTGRGIILSGGPNSVHAADAPQIPDWVLTANIPILGVCYGMQALAQQLGGQVELSDKHEYGHADITVSNNTGLFANTLIEQAVWMSHGDKLTQLPPEFIGTAHTSNTPYAAMAHKNKLIFGVQFHPEVTHTAQGRILLENFINLCQCQRHWQAPEIIAQSLAEIKTQVGQDKVILGLSGGVDSSVLAALLHQAIGEQLLCIFVDTGLLRAGEAAQVEQTFQNHFGANLMIIEASNQFYQALHGVSDPEEKRKIIGREFINIFQAEAKKHPDVKWLAQGTIYPDVIESTLIKSHHNVGGLPESLHLKLLEPLRECFKDEVRKLGLALGLPFDMVHRHPFPGPGLGVRVLGEIKADYIHILQQADKIFIDALYQADLYHKVSQAFAVFLPIKSVGVTGDARRYEYVIALRAVETTDFMTAHWAKLPYDFLSKISHRIINEIPQVSRVVYDISGKPPATIEWE